MSPKQYYSIRTGKNPNAKGLGLEEIRDLFLRLYSRLDQDGYFTEAFGFYCEGEHFNPGKIADPEYEILINIRKKNIWPIEKCCANYSEDDLLDIIEFLFEHISKPIDGSFHGGEFCGTHWETFNKNEGQQYFREKVNELLHLYREQYSLSNEGEVLHKVEKGFEKIFEADTPTEDKNIQTRIDTAIIGFRKHGSSLDDRRKAVRDLADVLEYLRPNLKTLISKKDEADLFNIANNFGIRHHNDQQKTNYDKSLWLSWMFYFYLSTIHVVLRKINRRAT